VAGRLRKSSRVAVSQGWKGVVADQGWVRKGRPDEGEKRGMVLRNYLPYGWADVVIFLDPEVTAQGKTPARNENRPKKPGDLVGGGFE